MLVVVITDVSGHPVGLICKGQERLLDLSCCVCVEGQTDGQLTVAVVCVCGGTD